MESRAQSSIQKNEISPAIPKRTAPTFSRARNYVKQYEGEREGEKESNVQRHRYIEKFQRPFLLPAFPLLPSSSPRRRFTSKHPLSPFLPYPAPPPSGQRLMRGMQFPQALARLSSGAPFPYVPTISPAPTCAFVLIRSGWIREEILRGREILSFSRKCVGDPIILARFKDTKWNRRLEICCPY